MAKEDAYVDSLRTLHAALNDYMLLLGEPCPLLGQVCMRLIEVIGCLPPGDEAIAANMDKLAAITLEASILGIVDRLEGLEPHSEKCLQSIKDCMNVTDALSIHDRCAVFFKVLGIAITGLREITNQEYPQLADGTGKKLGR
ncbi:MAG: hypothetical protein WC919_07165 [Candidatus Paceibacterota bacterium]|jgi:hypothetical protein